jgi:hypothetical protein
MKKGGVKIITPGPVTVETIRAEKRVMGKPFKMEILTKVPLPPDHVRCIVLEDYKGMEDDLYRGDIVDLPERRFKSLSLRGKVKQYFGEKYPNKRR